MLHTVLPMLDKIKVHVANMEEMWDLSAKLFVRGLHLNESKFGFMLAAEKDPLWISIKTEVYSSTQDRYESYRSKGQLLGVPIELSKEEFLHVVEMTPIVFNSTKLSWRSLYGKYMYPHLYS